MDAEGVFPCDVTAKYIHIVKEVNEDSYIMIREMKVFEEIEIGQEITQATEQSGTWSNIDYGNYYSGYATLPVNPLNIFGITDFI